MPTTHNLLLALCLATAGCASVPASSIDRDAIRAVVQTHMRELRECYYQTLDTNPAAEGKLQLVFDLGPSGRASQAHIENVVGKRGIEAVEPCLVSRVSSWEFPKPTEETTINYPLFFSENGKTNFEK